MKKMLWHKTIGSIALIASMGFSVSAHAAVCAQVPSHSELTSALKASVASEDNEITNGGLDLNMWATIVDRDGRVCSVTMTGDDRGDQWPGSRVISAQKANTANSFSLPGLALATANLWAATQPGGSLYGLQHSNPVDSAVAYGAATIHGGGSALKYGTSNDPMRNKFIGGVNVFGGGLALYDEAGTLIGAVGVSGDTSCADHNVAWRVRQALGLDNVPNGVGGGQDRIVYDVALGASAGGFGHPTCGGSEDTIGFAIGSAIAPGSDETL